MIYSYTSDRLWSCVFTLVFQDEIKDVAQKGEKGDQVTFSLIISLQTSFIQEENGTGIQHLTPQCGKWFSCLSNFNFWFQKEQLYLTCCSKFNSVCETESIAAQLLLRTQSWGKQITKATDAAMDQMLKCCQLSKKIYKT